MHNGEIGQAEAQDMVDVLDADGECQQCAALRREVRKMLDLGSVSGTVRHLDQVRVVEKMMEGNQ